MKISRYRGFTIWQLLGVLFLLFIVAAILFPVIAPQRGPSRAFCQSNQKQIALAFLQYIQDYDEVLPAKGNVIAREGKGWADLLQPYTKSTRIFHCPLDTAFPRDGAITRTRFTNYYYNMRLSKISITRLRNANATLLLGEGIVASSNYSCSSFDSCTGFTDDGLVGPVPNAGKARHLEGANYAFVDGHVKWYKPQKVSVLPGKNSVISFAFLLNPD